jgi:hypothetical protein
MENLSKEISCFNPKNNNMERNLFMIIIAHVFACAQTEKPYNLISMVRNTEQETIHISKIDDIPLPKDYIRMHVAAGSFAHWLRQLPLKKDTRVYLYNGALKANQTAQFAVLDIPVGTKDLQQCADAVMRLRAEYLYSQKRYPEISFADNNGKKYTCPANIDRPGFERYLKKVFSYCGTLSLEKQLKPVTAIQPGDVFIKGGSPGHAVMVMDVATNSQGNKIYLLAQSYMPAQDIHILRNAGNESLNPWYAVIPGATEVHTPEWTFKTNQLRRW